MKNLKSFLLYYLFKFKKICPVVLAGVFCLGFPVNVFADEIFPSDSLAAGTTISSEVQIAESAFGDIKDQIIDDYSELYKLDDFSYDYTLRDEVDKKYLDINVYVDMTLIRHPSESPYVLGMEKALSEVKDAAIKEVLQDDIDAYVDEIETLCFNIPDRSTFTYAVELDNAVNALSADQNYTLYYRTDTDKKVLLTDADCLAEVEDFNESYQAGYQALESLESDARAATVNIDTAIAPQASFTYDRIAARDWARNNWNAAPEYPSSVVSGTDCANFVSKALNAGGIPEDKSGKWYRASTWGGWPGDHWFRTGYNGKTGVVIYMTNKGYFNKVTNKSVVSAGCIMYWNNTSHVALVTYGDGSTIKYTQHGASQTKDTVYRSENASFYKASKSIS